ncbi:MAG: prepilin-type N-terminal cleavage/methylation domain-containing protein [Candidatus Saccharimonadales bacterium]
MERTRHEGFSIIELLVAIVIGSIMIGGISLIVTSHTYISQRGRDLIVANAYAERKVESLRSLGFLGLNNGVSDITSELPSELNPPRNAQLEISDASSGIKKIKISLTYNEQGAVRDYTYTTYIGELGVGQY